MSLVDIYNANFGEEEDISKLAEALEGLSEEEIEYLEKVAEVEEQLEDLSEEELEELAGLLENDDDDDEDEEEKVAAELVAAGRIIARGYIDEIDKEASIKEKATKGVQAALKAIRGAGAKADYLAQGLGRGVARAGKNVAPRTKGIKAALKAAQKGGKVGYGLDTKKARTLRRILGYGTAGAGVGAAGYGVKKALD